MRAFQAPRSKPSILSEAKIEDFGPFYSNVAMLKTGKSKKNALLFELKEAYVVFPKGEGAEEQSIFFKPPKTKADDKNNVGGKAT